MIDLVVVVDRVLEELPGEEMVCLPVSDIACRNRFPTPKVSGTLVQACNQEGS